MPWVLKQSYERRQSHLIGPMRERFASTSMTKDRNDIGIASLAVASRLRGLYSRVAKRLGVDPSYVSRVASGQRRSETIQAELENQINKILAAKDVANTNKKNRGRLPRKGVPKRNSLKTD